MLFFKETAEELVNRLFDEWLTKNTFPDNLFLTSPNFKSSLIKRLEKFDKNVQKDLDKLPNTDYTARAKLENQLNKNYWEEYFLNQRKEFIFINFINKMNRHFNHMLAENPPPKPTQQSKNRHLRLVVNNG